MVAAAREAVPAGKTLLVGAGAESTRTTIAAERRRRGRRRRRARPHPGVFKSQMTTDVFVRHYTAVADASPVPVLLYNFPRSPA